MPTVRSSRIIRLASAICGITRLVWRLSSRWLVNSHSRIYGRVAYPALSQTTELRGIPLRVQRPLRAPRAHRHGPLIQAAGADAACIERVPGVPAVANPSLVRSRRPVAFWTANERAAVAVPGCFLLLEVRGDRAGHKAIISKVSHSFHLGTVERINHRVDDNSAICPVVQCSLKRTGTGRIRVICDLAQSGLADLGAGEPCHNDIAYAARYVSVCCFHWTFRADSRFPGQ